MNTRNPQATADVAPTLPRGGTFPAVGQAAVPHPPRGTAATQTPPGGFAEPRQGPPGGMTWTIPLPPGTRLLTSNNRLHHMARHAESQRLQGIAITLARKHKLPLIAQARIAAVYRKPSKRHPMASQFVRDAGALAPTVKAFLDGLVKAGVFRDDASQYVLSETYAIATERVQLGQLVIHIETCTP